MCAWCVCVSFFHIHIKIAYAALSSCTGHKTHFTHTSIISMCICTHNRPIYCIHLVIFERKKKSILYTRNYMKLAFVNLFLSPSLSIFFFRGSLEHAQAYVCMWRFCWSFHTIHFLSCSSSDNWASCRLRIILILT